MVGYDHRLYRLAEQRGWWLPASKTVPPSAWNRYWSAMKNYETMKATDPDSDPGRPIPPVR